MALSLINKTQLDPNISDLVSGYGLNFFYPANNPSGFATGLSFDPISFIRTGQSGLFYPATNPNNYITGVDLSSYAKTGQIISLSGDLTSFVSNFTATQYATQSYVGQSIIAYNLDTVKAGDTGQFFPNTLGTNLQQNLATTGGNLSGNLNQVILNLASTGSTLTGQTLLLSSKIDSFSGDFLKTGYNLSGQIVSFSGTFNYSGLTLSGQTKSIKDDLNLSGKNISNAITSFSGTFNYSGVTLSGYIDTQDNSIKQSLFTTGKDLTAYINTQRDNLSQRLFDTGNSLTQSIASTNQNATTNKNDLTALINSTGSKLSGYVVASDTVLQSQINTINGNLFDPLLYPMGVASAWVMFNGALAPILCTGSSGTGPQAALPNSSGAYFNNGNESVTAVTLYCNNSSNYFKVDSCICISKKAGGNAGIVGCYKITGADTTKVKFDIPGRPTARITGAFSGWSIIINSNYNVPLMGYRDIITGGSPKSPFVYSIYPWNTANNSKVMPDNGPCVLTSMNALTDAQALNTPPAFIRPANYTTQTFPTMNSTSPSSYINIGASQQFAASVVIFTNKNIA